MFRDDEGCASSLQEKQLSAHMDGDNVKPNKTYASLKGGNRGVMQKKTNYQKMKVVAHTLKDMDLDKCIVIPIKYRNRLLNQCEKDIEFLTKHVIMDYSLLLGIYTHDTDAYANDGRMMNLSISDLLKQSQKSDIATSSQKYRK